MLPTFPAKPLVALATLQLTATIAPVEAVAVQSSSLPEEKMVGFCGGFVVGSTHVTALIAVAGSMVKVCVAVRVESA
jgi:hypothetical protein